MREKVRSASGRRRPAIGTHDELLELGIQPLELPLEEVDDKALVALLGVNEEALAASHDANNLPEQKRESSASMATRRGGGGNNEHHVSLEGAVDPSFELRREEAEDEIHRRAHELLDGLADAAGGEPAGLPADVGL
jgi:hypothetical protein